MLIVVSLCGGGVGCDTGCGVSGRRKSVESVQGLESMLYVSKAECWMWKLIVE